MIIFDHVSIIIADRQLLLDTSLTLSAGEKVVLCGKSGSGKSTLLKALVGGQRLSSGAISINGNRVSPEHIGAIRSQLAYIPQEPLLAHKSVHDDLLLPFTFKAHQENRPTEQDIHSVLARLHLASAILERNSATLSGGEKQRLVIARAILLGKKIFLADEITSALDPESKEAVMAFLLDSEHTVVSISHDPDWIDRCDRVFTLADGKLEEGLHGNH